MAPSTRLRGTCGHLSSNAGCPRSERAWPRFAIAVGRRPIGMCQTARQARLERPCSSVESVTFTLTSCGSRPSAERYLRSRPHGPAGLARLAFAPLDRLSELKFAELCQPRPGGLLRNPQQTVRGHVSDEIASSLPPPSAGTFLATTASTCGSANGECSHCERSEAISSPRTTEHSIRALFQQAPGGQGHQPKQSAAQPVRGSIDQP
jgi:hypothetical protein